MDSSSSDSEPELGDIGFCGGGGGGGGNGRAVEVTVRNTRC